MKICPNCDEYYGDNDFYCIKCRYRLRAMPKEEQEQRSQAAFDEWYAQNSIDHPRCPSCQSYSTKRLSFANRYLHWKAVGLLSKTARSEFVCVRCGHKW